MIEVASNKRNILIAANLIGVCAATSFHPHIKVVQSPVMEWLYLSSLPIAGAAICYGIYALVFRNSARSGWPMGFLALAWLFAISNIASSYMERKPMAKVASIVRSEPWTQESTRSVDKGPWLDYAPAGSRFCRAADGKIVTVFPPGVKPGAPAADPLCISTSVASADML